MKDNKGRTLKANECQLKDGRYQYRYTDKSGKRRAVYSYRLVASDVTPKGKKDYRPLREIIKEVGRDNADGFDRYGARSTVKELVDTYISTKPRLANSTKENYINMNDKNIGGHMLGKMAVSDVRMSDIKQFYKYLYVDRHFSPNSIQLYQNLLYPAFQMAVDDDLIRKNPCRNCMKDYARGSKHSSRDPLTREQQIELLKFLQTDPIYRGYYPLVAFMLSTGCRISETLGLTWDDIDFENKIVKVDHQLIYRKKDGKCQHYISTTKNGTSREIPLQDDMIKILLEHRRNTFFISAASNEEFDGYRNFIFVNREGRVNKAETINRAFNSIRERHNKNAELNDVLIPEFSCHTLRHTFCTRMAELGIDIKVLQEIMGHKNASVTMQIYNLATKERIQDAFNDLPKILLA